MRGRNTSLKFIKAYFKELKLVLIKDWLILFINEKTCLKMAKGENNLAIYFITQLKMQILKDKKDNLHQLRKT